MSVPIAARICDITGCFCSSGAKYPGISITSLPIFSRQSTGLPSTRTSRYTRRPVVPRDRTLWRSRNGVVLVPAAPAGALSLDESIEGLFWLQLLGKCNSHSAHRSSRSLSITRSTWTLSRRVPIGSCRMGSLMRDAIPVTTLSLRTPDLPQHIHKYF